MVKQLMTTAALVALLAAPALSQETQDQTQAPAAPADTTGTAGTTGTTGSGEAPALPPMMEADMSEVTAENLIGSPVVNVSEEKLGTVDDALFDSDGKLKSVVVAFGGFLGFGTKTVELPIDQVTVKTRGDGAYAVESDLTPESLAGMPAYEAS